MSLHKTTLYLPEDDLLKLKHYAQKTSHKSLTYHIQRAIKIYLKNLKSEKSKEKFKVLLKYKSSSKGSRFGDPIKYQRKLRHEWE